MKFAVFFIFALSAIGISHASEPRLLSYKYGPPVISKLDSVEIKLINWDVNFEEYYGIDRKAFDQTFEYMSNNSLNNNSIAYVKIKDELSLDMFLSLIMWTIEPYPSEAISIFPNEILRRSKGYNTENHGIMQGSASNDDPLQIRGKITLYTPYGRRIAYISNHSIDILNHRYRLGKALEELLLSIKFTYEKGSGVI